MVQKVIRKVVSGISIALIIFSVFILLTVLFTRNGKTPSYFGYSVFRVLTGSMEPEYPVGTLIFVKNCGAEEIQQGDVISFYTLEDEIRGSVVTHRVVGIRQDGDRISFITRGDANSIEDSYPVEPEYLIGKVIGKSILLGKLVKLLTNPVVFLLVILIPLIIILVLTVKETIDTAKQIAREEAEQEFAARQKETPPETDTQAQELPEVKASEDKTPVEKANEEAQ